MIMLNLSENDENIICEDGSRLEETSEVNARNSVHHERHGSAIKQLSRLHAALAEQWP